MQKRQLREQSADVEDCFEDCQEFGYHFDADVHVGNLAPEGNPFALLNADYSRHSTPDPIPTPYRQCTFRPPTPFVAELEWHVAKKPYPKLEDVDQDGVLNSESNIQPLHVPANDLSWHTSCQLDDLKANRASVSKSVATTIGSPKPTLQTTSLPVAPHAVANINLPGSFPQDESVELISPPSKKRKLNESPPPSFTNEYRIPSPLLYHKPSGDALPNVDDGENPCVCLGPSFEHCRDKHQSIFDTISNQSSCGEPRTSSMSKTRRPLLQQDYRFIAAALPQMGMATPASPVEQAVLSGDSTFHTNTLAYLWPGLSAANSKSGTVTSTPMAQKPIQAMSKAKKLTSHIFAAEDVRPTDTPALGSRHTSRATSISSQLVTLPAEPEVSQSHSVIFPNLLQPTACRERSLDRYFERTSKLWSKQKDKKGQQPAYQVAPSNDTVDYVVDRKSKFQSLWDAYERAILGPKADLEPPTTSANVLPQTIRVPNVGIPDPTRPANLLLIPVKTGEPKAIDIKLPKQVDVYPCSLSTCTTVVPAKLCEKQYVNLPRGWNSEIWSLEQWPLPATNAISKHIQHGNDQERVEQAAEWVMQELGLQNQFHRPTQDDDREVQSFFQAGWDGNLFHLQEEAALVPLPQFLPFEDAELEDEGYGSDVASLNSGGLLFDDEDDEETCFDWDDEGEGWSDPSEDEFFEFEKLSSS